jgi:hypothetical protein
MQGAVLGDALLRNTMPVKWRIIHIGDPLYRPFPKGLGEWAVSPADPAPADSASPAGNGTDRIKNE